MPDNVPDQVKSPELLADIRRMIEETRSAVAATVNAGLTTLYWRIGKRINEEVLDGLRAEYGKEILATLVRELTQDYGGGFSYSSLTRMARFAEVFSDARNVATLSQQLGWSHFKEILPLNKPLQREFYAEMCRIERWSVRTLRRQIDSMLYERTALSRKPDELIQSELARLRDEDRLSPDMVFKDPYILDFLGYLDLLFYNRRLRRLVALDLKLADFKPGDKGQMELYLRWLDKYERQPGEDAPLGIILCAGKKQEQRVTG